MEKFIRPMSSIEKFVHFTNLKLLREQLSEANDDDKRRMLIRLLRQEEGKFPNS
jgi:hypothetical protein